MADRFGKAAINKPVIGTDGTKMGVLHDITVDVRTGALVNLVVEPDISFNTEGCQQENGLLLVPFGSVKSIEDFIMVDRSVMY